MALAVVGASCRALFDINGYEDSIAVFCKLLDRCYEGGAGECHTRIYDKLVSGSLDPWETWLSELGNNQCLESCRAARRCLDRPILCDLGPCASDEDCCSSLGGRSVCRPGEDPEVKVCCAPVGAPCTSQLPCCEGMGPCDKTTGRCGGVFCREADAACSNNFECCSGLCRNSMCAAEVCAANGFPCESHDECCSEFCDLAKGGECSDSPCGLIGQPCSDASPCCEANGGVCYVPEGAVTGVCSPCEGKLPNENDCGSDDQCCSGYCSPQIFQCANSCGGVGDPCEVGEDCCEGICMNGQCDASGCSSGACEAAADCCSGKCVGGQCAPKCVDNPECLHTVCTPGAPLPAGVGGCSTGQNCINEICGEDDFCCCTAWDSLCVASAKSNPTCANLCP